MSWEGDEEDTPTDDYSPWELYGADANEDTLKSQMLGSGPAVLAGCKKLGQKCHSITVKVCCTRLADTAKLALAGS